MYCSQCGSKLPDDAAFCPSCGGRVSGGASAGSSIAEVVGNVVSTAKSSIAEHVSSPAAVEMTPVYSPHGKRSELYVTCGKPTIEEAMEAAHAVLQANGYKLVDYKGEQVWKKGTGVLTAMMFIKVAAFGSCIGIQAWTQAGLGNKGFKEMSLDGFIGSLPKKMVLDVVDAIRYAVQ